MDRSDGESPGRFHHLHVGPPGMLGRRCIRLCMDSVVSMKYCYGCHSWHCCCAAGAVAGNGIAPAWAIVIPFQSLAQSARFAIPQFHVKIFQNDIISVMSSRLLPGSMLVSALTHEGVPSSQSAEPGHGTYIPALTRSRSHHSPAHASVYPAIRDIELRSAGLAT